MLSGFSSEMRTQLELVEYAPDFERLSLEYGFALGYIWAARTGGLVPDKVCDVAQFDLVCAFDKRKQELIDRDYSGNYASAIDEPIDEYACR